MSKPKEYSWMTKDKLMTYTVTALLILAVVAVVLWWPVTTPSGWNLGFTVAMASIIAVGLAVGIDALLHKVTKDSPLNTMSAAVFGLIVALSYSLGVPAMRGPEAFFLPLEAPDAFLYVALISIIGLVLFKKLQGLAGRKYVNPAAAAKLVVLVPFFNSVLIAADHLKSGALGVPALAGPIGYDIIGGNGLNSFAGYILSCFANPMVRLPTTITTNDVLNVLILEKFHGWVGGASSIAVIIVGLGLFIAARRYIKWRITVAYLVTVTLMSLVLAAVYGGDALLRIEFELFIGSSIFLAFFMATDPATTPLTYLGQGIFGVGLGVLTVLIQTYMNFFGGSILALIIMNLTSPFLDKVGILRPKAAKKEPKLPKAKLFTTVKTTPCIRCGACMRICCNKLSPILIKEAFDKQNVQRLMKLESDYCAGCENCNFVCPARINLRSYMLNYPMLEEDARKIEQQFLKGTADENIGVYTDMFSAKSSIDGQDGGVATALLVSGMQRSLFDSAIVVQRIHGYWAEAVIAENVDEVLKAKGTKYIRVSMMSKLGDLVAKGKRKIAIVGTACQVRAARRIQQSLLGKYPDLELTVIGLFCFEEFNYEKLKEETARLLGVDLDRAEKTQIRKGKYIVRVDGKDNSVRVRELSNAVDKQCLSCDDFTAKYSDISVGAVGSDDGYSTVIVRSDVGEKLLEGLDLAKGEVKKEEVTKLAIQKKERTLPNS
jgi:coenzyme F420-reducing hydrogenase beta subunit/Na+-translocating ferredoxin:NAD+ oxidoreductase RnfD subunit